ncbi:hypothetical protein [Aquipuribacter nitratireducens]|uniref:Uncharacterized protein n=1 Tax=Aquipuribacter nitratireducens TaxID=650104 RepID=A0ABW0GSS8_9MICO
MRTYGAHRAWLLVSAVLIGGFGPVFALGATESTAAAARWTLDLLDWPVDGAASYDAATTRFLSALTGGFLLGWGVMVLCLRQWVFDVAPEGVRRSLVVGASSWFVLDSAGSLAAGAASNVLFNVAVLLLVVGPMWLPARDGAHLPTPSTTRS